VSRLVEIQARKVTTSDRAILIEYEGEEVWVPLSWCEVTPGPGRDQVTLDMEEHHAREKGFI